jgi:hypothetical protein
MRPRQLVTPIALVVSAAGVCAYALIVDRTKVSDADRTARSADVFPSFRVEEARRLELSRGNTRFVLERTGSDASPWRLTAPRVEDTDPGAVDALLRELELSKKVRTVDENEALGLREPRVKGHIDLGALSYTFVLGADAPHPPGAAYMSLVGEGSFVVSPALKVQLLRAGDSYRSHTLVGYGANDIARLDVDCPATHYGIERAGAAFRVGARDGRRASRKTVDSVLTSLADLRAESFLDETQRSRTPDAPLVSVTVTPRGDGKPRIQFTAGGACPEHAGDVVVVRTQPTLVAACARKTAIDGLCVGADALDDKSPLFARGDEIQELKIEPVAPSAGPRVELARIGSGWLERAPEMRELSTDEAEGANALVFGMAGAQAVEDGSNARDASKGPAHDGRLGPLSIASRVTITRTGEATEVVELGGRDEAGFSLARRLDDGAVLRLPRSAARRFEPHPVVLRKHPLWAAPFNAAEVSAIDNTCSGTPESLELRGGRWSMRKPAGFAADTPSALDLADAIAKAKAELWVAERDDGSFGFDSKGACEVTLTLQADPGRRPAAKRTLLFGAAGEGGVYARVRDDPAVFVASQALHALASHPAIDRSRLRLNLAETRQVTLVRGAERLVLRTLAGRLVRASSAQGDGPSAQGDASSAEGEGSSDPLVAAVTALYARDALHAGPAMRDEGFDRPTLEIQAVAADPSGRPYDTRLVFGAQGRDGPASIRYCRLSGVDATFATPAPLVDAILKAWDSAE